MLSENPSARPVVMPVMMLVVLALLWSAGCAGRSEPPASVPAAAARPGEPAATGSVPGGPFALQVLHAWDADRARAWEQGDLVALRDLYPPGSALGAADVRLLKRYRARGLVLNGLQMQVLAVRTLVSRPSRVRLVVDERFAGARSVLPGGTGKSGTVPGGAVVRRLIELHRREDAWVLVRSRPWQTEAP